MEVDFGVGSLHLTRHLDVVVLRVVVEIRVHSDVIWSRGAVGEPAQARVSASWLPSLGLSGRAARRRLLRTLAHSPARALRWGPRARCSTHGRSAGGWSCECVFFAGSFVRSFECASASWRCVWVSNERNTTCGQEAMVGRLSLDETSCETFAATQRASVLKRIATRLGAVF